MNRLRSRDGPVCSPEKDPETPNKKSGSFGNPFDRIKKFLGIPTEEPPNSYDWIPEKPNDPRCLPGFPYHLCCPTRDGPGNLEPMTVPGDEGNLLENYSSCRPGAWLFLLPCLFLPVVRLSNFFT